MYDVDGPNRPPSEIVNIAPGEGESPLLQNLTEKHLDFLKTI